MENLQKYEKNIETLKANIELKTQELSQQRKLIEEDNIRLEGMRKFIDPSIKSQIMVDAMNQSNIQVDKEIENNKKKIEKAEDGIKRMHKKIESNKHSLKEGIDNNREEAKRNKAEAFAKYSIKNKKFNENIEKGRAIKLKLKAYAADKDNKDVYKAASEEHAKHMQHMKELARERNEAWKAYNEASKVNEKILMDTQELINKYDLEEKENDNSREDDDSRGDDDGREDDDSRGDDDGREDDDSRGDDDGREDDEGKNKKDKISIGRTGVIVHNGKTYKIPEKAIKEGINVDISNDAEVEKFIQENMSKYAEMDDNTKSQVKDFIKNEIMDTTVLRAINCAEMSDEDKFDIFTKYSNNILEATKGKAKMYDLDVTYNMKKLSETKFWSRLFKKDTNILAEQDKAKILGRALKAERYGLGAMKGEYKPTFKAKLLNLLQGNKLPELPVYKIDELHQVAAAYNKARYDGYKTEEVDGKEEKTPILKSKGEFRKAIKVELNDKKTVFNKTGLSKSQQTELKNLRDTELNRDEERD